MRRPPGWVPNQHGAWAMLVLPVAVGALRAGPRWDHLHLLVAWLVAYLAFFAAGTWLRSRRRARYRPALVTYAGAAAVVGAPLLLRHPELVRWAVVYAPLLATSLWFSHRRADRHLVNDLVTVTAACVMTVVAYGLRAPDDGVWLPGAGEGTAWVLATVLLAYLAGTALYVKTMIRERGNPVMYRVSVAYHALVAAILLGLLPVVGVVFVVIAARAALVPHRWPSARPPAIGIGEVVASVVLGAVLVLVPLGL